MRYWAEISVMCISFLFFLIFSFLEALLLLQNRGWAVSKEHEENA